MSEGNTGHSWSVTFRQGIASVLHTIARIRATLQQLGSYSLLEGELVRLESTFLAVGISPAAPIDEPPLDLRAATQASEGLDDDELRATVPREIEGLLKNLHEFHESTQRARKAIQDRPGIEDEMAALEAADFALSDFFHSDAAH